MLELVLISSSWVLLAIQCSKKKNEAGKLKPRNLDAPAPPTSPLAGTPNNPQTPPVVAEKPMAPREADDNETINDAKSDWGGGDKK